MKYKRLCAIVLVSLLLTLTGCTKPSPTLAPIQQEETFSPALRTITGANYVCSETTQLHLQAVVDYATLNSEAGEWQLYAVAEEGIIHSGIWDLTNSEVILTSVDEKALPAGDYEARFIWQNQLLGSHPFTVSSIEPGITNLSISTIPQHVPLTELAEGTQHFYVNFAWVGGCENSPYQLEVYHDRELVCQHNEILIEDSGSASQPCYIEDGSVFEPGEYRVIFTLMKDTAQDLAFNVSLPAPTPTPMPTPHPIECSPAFSASGITPDGEIFRPLDIYEWYVQAIYVGTECKNLTPNTEWSSIWYRDGQMVRSITQTWDGGDSGIVWDSFTGTQGDPFVVHGTYTTTLEIGAAEPITTEFRVLVYTPSDSGDN